MAATGAPYPPEPVAPPRPTKPIDVSAAACAARGERADRRMRIAGRVLMLAAVVAGVWFYASLDLSRLEGMGVVIAFLLLRLLYVVERGQQQQPAEP